MVMLVASLGYGDGTRLEDMEVRVTSNEDGGGSVVWQRLWWPGVSPEMGDGAGKHSMCVLVEKNKYRWNPSIEVDVRRVFNKIGSKSFSDCMSKARKKAEKPKFMNQVTWEALCRVWILPTFVAKSERGKTARQSNKRLHTGGSIPINEHKTKLREELSREPSVSELFLLCHQNKKTKVFVDATAKATWEGYNAVHGADDALDAQCGNGAKTFPKWIDRVGSKNGTTYGVRDVDEYVCQPNIEEPSALNIPNVEIVQLVDLVKVQQVEHNLMKTEINNLKNAHEAQSKKLDQVVKAQSSSEKRLRKFVAQEVGKVVANEVGKVVAEEVGKATQQILDAIRIRPV
ncbi:1,3-beta-glucan synthase subunit FKS1-like protein [Tanacetum coccineum]